MLCNLWLHSHRRPGPGNCLRSHRESRRHLPHHASGCAAVIPVEVDLIGSILIGQASGRTNAAIVPSARLALSHAAPAVAACRTTRKSSALQMSASRWCASTAASAGSLKNGLSEADRAQEQERQRKLTQLTGQYYIYPQERHLNRVFVDCRVILYLNSAKSECIHVAAFLKVKQSFERKQATLAWWHPVVATSRSVY